MARRHYVYSLRSRGRTTYIGKTTNPKRRAAQHRRDGKTGSMKIERSFFSDRAARRYETSRRRWGPTTAYRSKTSVKVKVLDFVKSGGPVLVGL